MFESVYKICTLVNFSYSATEWENVKKIRITKCNSYRRNWICLNATMIEFLPWWNHMKSCSLFLQRSFKINSKKLPGRLSFDRSPDWTENTWLAKTWTWSHELRLFCDAFCHFILFSFFYLWFIQFFHFLKYLIGVKAFTKVWTRTLWM